MPRLRLAIGLLSALCLGCARETTGGGAGAAPPRDVVVLLIDTLRADWLDAYAEGRGTSPHIDRLAREGVVFVQASSAAPWTLPSVVSLFTSSFVAEHDVTRDGKVLAPGFTTWAEHMRALGYATVSLHRNPYAGELSGLDRGFDVCRMVGGPIDGARVRPFVRGAGDRPLFLYLHDIQPHDPYRAPAEMVARFGAVPEEVRGEIAEASGGWRRLSRADFVKGQALGSTDNAAGLAAEAARLEARLEEVHALYSGAVAEADRCVGEVLAELEAAGRYDDALILLVSDHGEEMGEHGGWQHDQSLYEELVHVPLVVRLPGGRHAGRRVAAPVSLVDLMPTVLELLGAPGEAPEARGHSLVPLLEDDAPAGPPRVVALRWNVKKHYGLWPARGDRNVALRDGRWKAIWNADADTVELYDLEADPGEQRDLGEEEPERARRMAALARESFEAQLARRTAAGERTPDSVSEETRGALQDLGYVGDDE